MQTATSTLLEAIQSRERTPVARVKADWGRTGTYVYDPGVYSDTYSDTYEPAGDMGDLTGWVEQLSVERSLSTDLPDSSKVVTGYGAAAASITLSGDMACGTGLVQALRGGSGSLTRVNTPVTIDLGFVGSAGPEYLRSFTGKIRSVDINPGDNTVTLSLLDGRESIRTPVTYPVLRSSDGADGVYFMTWIANANNVTLTAEPSLNPALATAVVDISDPWATLQQLAEAEQGVILFDENNGLKFYNRNHMVGGAAVATLTTDPDTFANLKAVTASETIDAVANFVTVSAAPMALDPSGTVIWSSDAVLAIETWTTLQVPISADAPIYTVTNIAFTASSTISGSAPIGNVTGGFVSTGTSTGTLYLTNRNGVTVYLVDASGDPSLSLSGRCLRPAAGSDFLAVIGDPTSQATYGVQPLDVAGNPWRQSPAFAQALAAYLLTSLKDPHVTLSSVEIVGDPRLQLCDRVRVVEMDGLALDKEFWCVGLTTTFGADGLSQSVALREA